MNALPIPRFNYTALIFSVMLVFITSTRAAVRITSPPGEGTEEETTLYLNRRLTLRATGDDATKILNEMEDSAHRTLTLYLNGVRIPNLTASHTKVSADELQKEADTLEKELEKAKDAQQKVEKEFNKIEAEAKAKADEEGTAAEAKALADAAKTNVKPGGGATKVEELDQETKNQAHKEREAVKKEALDNHQNLRSAKNRVQERRKTVTDIELRLKGVKDVVAGTQSVVEITFTVTRDSSKPDSSKAWNDLLQPLTSFRNMMTVAVGVGEAQPVRAGREGVDTPQVLAFQAPRHLEWGIGVGVATVLLCGWMLWLFPQMLRDHGNSDYAFSLARTQMAIWGIVVIASSVGIFVALGTLEHVPSQTLMLMGISAATGLIARQIDSGRPPVPASRTGSWKDFFTDICVGDAGASFHRVQVLLWTLLLSAYFIRSVCDVISMPVFDSSMLLLLGISNGTYLGFKVQEGKLELGQGEIKDAKIETDVSGGGVPYTWSVTVDPPDAMVLATKEGQLKEPGHLSVPLAQPSKSCSVTLSITDKGKNAVSKTIPITPPSITPLELKEGVITTTISDGAGPYKWLLTSDQPGMVDAASGEQAEAGMLTLQAQKFKGRNKVTLTVTDGYGFTARRQELTVEQSLTVSDWTIQGHQLVATVTGGTGTIRWKLTDTPANPLIAKPSSDFTALPVGVPKITVPLLSRVEQDCKLQLTLIDEGRSVPMVKDIEVGKFRLTGLKVSMEDRTASAEIEGGTAPYKWTLTTKSVSKKSPEAGVSTRELNIPFADIPPTAPGALMLSEDDVVTLTVTDARGFAATADVNPAKGP